MNSRISKVVIQDTWNEDDDHELLLYTEIYNRIILSDRDILKLNRDNTDIDIDIDIEVIFCDTSIMQKLLPLYPVPDTYPEEFDKLYNRAIKKLPYSEARLDIYPFFIKPCSNDKSFEAYIVENRRDIKYLDKVISDHNTKVYISSVVKFVNEYRLFIGNNILYGVANASDYLIDGWVDKSAYPDYNNFIDEIFDIIKNSLLSDRYLVVDIGVFNDTWAVVEVNPPFALSSYEYPIEEYYAYCRDAWKYELAKYYN